jgi:hypothetical protein
MLVFQQLFTFLSILFHYFIAATGPFTLATFIVLSPGKNACDSDIPILSVVHFSAIISLSLPSLAGF